MAPLSLSRRRMVGSALATPLAGMSLEAASQQAAGPSGVYNALLFPEPPTLILALDQNTPAQVAAGKIYEGLLTYDFDLNPILARRRPGRGRPTA